MFEAVERLDEVIADLLQVDPDTLTDAELHQLVVALHRQTHRLACARARVLSRWDGRGVWADDGSRSAVHRLARDTSMAMSTARRELCRARHIESMPVTASALAAGDLSPDHVDWLGAANDGARRVVFAEHEPMLVEQCRQLRTFTGALRRAVQVRDRHCQHPAGCDVPVDDCDVDHTVPYANGGPTSQFNGRLQCPTQNRDSDKHDHDATPLPARPVTRLDELRARLRWQNHHYFQAESDDDHHDRDTG